ncbi:MAG TPA: helix-turn-helix domain-containing protein [Acidisarcina sp.]|nr:helix-turn-helix domain-containing protein [Acidisarcina sp.]
MSVRVMADVWDNGPEDAAQCAVLVALANFCNDDGGNCFPSVARVAKMLRYSERTVQRAIASLVADGWMTVERAGGRGVFSSYTIDVRRLKGCHPVTLSAGETKMQKGDIHDRKGDILAQKGDIHDIPPDPLFGVTIMNHHEPSSIIPPTPLQGDCEEKEHEAHAEGNGSAKDEAATKAGARRMESVSAIAGGIDAEAERVMRECGFILSNSRLRAVVSAALSLEREKRSRTSGHEAIEVAAISDEMIENYRQYVTMGEFLRFTWGPRKFFGDGHWINWQGWPIDQQRIDMRRGARAGL